MGGLTRFANVCKIVLIAAWLALSGARPLSAQYLGNVGQASTVSNYTIAAGTTETLVNACNASITTNCIKMIGQVSHLVQVNYDSDTQCTVLLEGSQDGTNWATLGAATFFNIIRVARFAQQTIAANGYYQLARLKANPGGGDTCGAMTGTYSGFQTPLPLTPIAQQFYSAAVSSAVNITGSSNFTPYLLTGFSCYNPNGSVAWLEFFDHGGTVRLGTTPFFFEQAIPAMAAFSYTGPNIEGLYVFQLAAVTAQGGSTPVSTGLSCNMQLNFAGPFVPFTPLIP
jgi:hypothetical protein